MAAEEVTVASEPPKSSRASAILTGITIVSTLVTLGLSIGNYLLKLRLDDAERQLKERVQALEESRERIARYDYVYKLLASIERADPSQRTLAINISRLALDDNEQRTLFSGLSFSAEGALAAVGKQGVEAAARDNVAGAIVLIANPRAEPVVLAIPGSTVITYTVSSSKPSPFSTTLSLSPDHSLYFQSPTGDLVKSLDFPESSGHAPAVVSREVTLAYGPGRNGPDDHLLTVQIDILIRDSLGFTIPGVIVLQID